MIKQQHWSIETANQRVQDNLHRIAKNTPKTYGIFSKTFDKQVKHDLITLSSKPHTELSGALVSVKALLDVKDQVTHAGTQFLTGIATKDATCVARLREAGTLLLGHSNMSELAYSGLGLNPHFGTADNPNLPNHIPGGSCSGGATSVASGLVDIAIGSDTGGSLRIPAAFCGITGFKPSQNTVCRKGIVPLSDTLDSIGPMANSVEDCLLAWQVMSGETANIQALSESRGLGLHISRNFGFNFLDPIIAEGFEALITQLRNHHLKVTDETLPFLDQYANITPWHLTAVESRAHFDIEFHQQADEFDPRIHSRMARADEISAIQYRQTLNQRTQFAADMSDELDGRVLLLPTVAILPPTFQRLHRDDKFNELNPLALRNTTLANVGDGCSLAIPFDYKGVTLSLMLIASKGADMKLLATGKMIQGLLESGVKEIIQ